MKELISVQDVREKALAALAHILEGSNLNDEDARVIDALTRLLATLGAT